MILLDTCALLWLSHRQENISPAALKRIDEATVVYVSAITGFEVGLKYRMGKLSLPVPPKSWFEQIIEHHDLSVINLALDISINAAELPLIHKDPCDRFIIATAMSLNLPVVTADSNFPKYGIDVFI